MIVKGMKRSNLPFVFTGPGKSNFPGAMHEKVAGR